MREGFTGRSLCTSLLVWIGCPNEQAIDAVDAAIAAKRKP
jgi:hypothetical protein